MYINRGGRVGVVVCTVAAQQGFDSRKGPFLCASCMSSTCLLGFPSGTPASTQRHARQVSQLPIGVNVSVKGWLSGDSPVMNWQLVQGCKSDCSHNAIKHTRLTNHTACKVYHEVWAKNKNNQTESYATTMNLTN